MELRKIILSSNACAFRAKITADYSDSVYSFEMDCSINETGEMTFEVIYPEMIAGITGRVSGENCSLTFDDYVLAFPPLTDKLVSPVCAPWVFINALQSGYVRGCTEENGQLILMIDDSYENESLELQVWLDEQDIPTGAEIGWEGRRIIALSISDFFCL